MPSARPSSAPRRAWSARATIVDGLTRRARHGRARGSGSASPACASLPCDHRRAASPRLCPQRAAGGRRRVRRRRAPRPTTRSRTRARRRASPSSATARLLEIARPGMSEDELAVELQVVHEIARRRGQFPPAVRRPAQSRGAAVDRPQARSTATSSSPRSRRAIAASWRRSAAPSWSARRLRELARQIRAGGAGDGPGHRAPRCRACRWRRSAAPSTRCWKREGYGEYCHPPHIRRRGHGLGFAFDAAGRRRARQRHAARARHGVHDPSEPVSAGDRLSAVRRAGADDRAGRRAADARSTAALAEIQLIRTRRMHTMHPTLADRTGRLGRRRACRARNSPRGSTRCGVARRQADGAIVYGGAGRPRRACLSHQLHAEARGRPRADRAHGRRRLLVGGGVNMLPAAKPLTWVDDLAAAAQRRQDRAAEWARGLGRRQRLMLIGGGAMPSALRRGIVDGARRRVAVDDGDADVRAHDARAKRARTWR